MQKNKLYIFNRIKSISYALRGFVALVKTEKNAKIHLLASITAILTGLLLEVSKNEWCILIFAIAMVWISETFNTAIEKTTDKLFTGFNEKAKYIKDISAGAVLISSIAALIVGLIIFVPKLFNYFYK